MPFLFAPSSAFVVIESVGKYGAAGLIAFGAALWYFQTSLIYPANVPKGSRTVVDAPSKYGMSDYKDIYLTTPDGVQLHAYAILHGEFASTRPTVLLLHANAGNMGHRLPIAKIFYTTLKMNVVMLSYRGYGKSKGSPTEKGIRKDAQTALDWILSHPELEKTTIVLYGQSIGGAVAIDLASRNQNAVHGLVVENTFWSIDRLAPHVLSFVGPFLFLLTEHWNSGKLMPKFKIDMPCLFLSGTQDELVPPDQFQELYTACSSACKLFVEFNNGTHNDTCVQPGYFEQIAFFLRKYVMTEDEAAIKATDNLAHRQATLDTDRIAALHPEADLQAMHAEAGSRAP